MILGNVCVSIVEIDTVFMVFSVTYYLELRKAITFYCTSFSIKVLYIMMPKHLKI